MIAINGVAPTLDGLESGAYRYGKILYVLHREQPGATAQRFIQFMRSEAGIKAMREAGCLPAGE